ncbi:MAG: UDP-N-acetylglucosamine pyrophosphorylase [Syntrophales bacterium]|nr:UDP-N-acetylglucosamine pyrophosphorylase [Syntrophales bacterium]
MTAGKVPQKVQNLIDKGVAIAAPLSMEIGDEVDIERISGDGVIFYSGTRIFGKKTLISPGAKFGKESPVTIENCRIGSGVELKGGYFKESVLLDGANLGSGAQVREGCLLEEESGGGHTVGLKQTILFPFVTMGSLINFCDCLMAGGTSRKDHSEVGSSYIHFNYTPNQDKATASLIGDVPNGVMLRERPIFLGGQGGIVGPARIGYGTVVAAGVVLRDDLPEGGMIIAGGGEAHREKPFHFGFYADVERRINHNINYIGNLMALKEWYREIRRPFFESTLFGRALYQGAIETLDSALKERIKRFGELAGKMPLSIEIAQKILPGRKGGSLVRRKKEFQEAWPRLKEHFETFPADTAAPERLGVFMTALQEKRKDRYIETIKALDGKEAAEGAGWLQAVISENMKAARVLLKG